MTRDSDEDIAWVRLDVEMRALLGAKYREGYVTGTEMNLRRRAAGRATRRPSPLRVRIVYK
jgi:hypothetical protein